LSARAAGAERPRGRPAHPSLGSRHPGLLWRRNVPDLDCVHAVRAVPLPDLSAPGHRVRRCLDPGGDGTMASFAGVLPLRPRRAAPLLLSVGELLLLVLSADAPGRATQSAAGVPGRAGVQLDRERDVRSNCARAVSRTAVGGGPRRDTTVRAR